MNKSPDVAIKPYRIVLSETGASVCDQNGSHLEIYEKAFVRDDEGCPIDPRVARIALKQAMLITKQLTPQEAMIILNMDEYDPETVERRRRYRENK